MNVRSYCEDDVVGVERILLAAYGNAMSPGMRSRLEVGANHAFVAEHDGRLAGFVMASDYGGVAYVASMGVDPAHQRQGAGRALMARLVDDLERAGIEAMLLDATDAGAPLYESFGFVDTDRTGVFERPASGSTTSAGRIDRADLERAVSLDRTLCACDRSSLLRTFAQEPFAFLAVRNRGYIMARAEAFGPFVADRTDAARALLSEAIAARPNARRLFIPWSNRAAVALAADNGFVETRSLRHMERGRSPLRRERVFGQASLGHG
jgi:GNAT superfamily N-acetyltransferase